jgi:hypothetical protein
MAMVDLRKLINKIQEQKQANVNLTLEFECDIETDDIQPLVKVINYFMNYSCKLAGDLKVEVTLNAAIDYYMLCFISPTTASEYPAINEQVIDILKGYDAEFEMKFQAGKYGSANLQFNLGE